MDTIAARKKFQLKGKEYQYFSLQALEGLCIELLPFSSH